MGSVPSKAATSSTSKKALEVGLKYFAKEARASHEIVETASNVQEVIAASYAGKQNAQDEKSFRELFAQEQKETALDRANRDLNDLYAPFGENRADAIAAQKEGGSRGK